MAVDDLGEDIGQIGLPVDENVSDNGRLVSRWTLGGSATFDVDAEELYFLAVRAGHNHDGGLALVPISAGAKHLRLRAGHRCARSRLFRATNRPVPDHRPCALASV